MFLPPRLLRCHTLISTSIETTAIRYLPPTFPRQSLQCRFKSRKPRKIDHSRLARAPAKSVKSNPSAETSEQVYEKLTLIGELLADLRNWRHSRLLLTLIVNSTVTVIFLKWVHEAAHNADIRPAEDSSTPSTEGRFVPVSEGKTRFFTPAQEWLIENFSVSPINLREGRYWTVVTSIFSHQLPIHACINVLISHWMFTGLSPAFGTIPVGGTFLVGGILGNLVAVAWMHKRGGEAFKERYPGLLLGGLGMSAGSLSMLGFATAIHPSWLVRVYGVLPVKLVHAVIVIWAYEVAQYFRQGGWEKVESSVCPGCCLLS
jgi:membrane associated rhomboid family serine protease